MNKEHPIVRKTRLWLHCKAERACVSLYRRIRRTKFDLERDVAKQALKHFFSPLEFKLRRKKPQ